MLTGEKIMDRILIISYGYDREYSNNANAICLHEIVDNSLKNNEVIIITSTTKRNGFIKTEKKNTTYYVPTKNKKDGMLNFRNWEMDIIKHISNNIDMQNISVLFTISFPFAVQEIGVKVKKMYPHLLWIVYELDPYAYNRILKHNKLMFIYRLMKQIKIFHMADKILLTHELYEQYSKNILSIYRDKFKDIGIPLMKICDVNKIRCDNNCNIAYVGSFYKGVRDPEYMLDILIRASSRIDGFKLNLYGPEIDSLPSKYREQYGEKLAVHGRVSKDRVIAAMKEADILVNIGNTVKNQLPSKILEYIGTGKPIINFYSISEDTSNKYLSRYPNALLIRKDNRKVEKNVMRIVEFINSQKGKKVEINLLKDLYQGDTLDAVSKRIMKEIY